MTWIPDYVDGETKYDEIYRTCTPRRGHGQHGRGPSKGCLCSLMVMVGVGCYLITLVI